MGGFCEVIWKFSFRSLLIHISLDWHNLLMLNALYYSYASILCWQFSRRKFRLYKQLPPWTEEGGICQIFSPWHTKGSYISKLVDSKWNSLNPILNHHQVNILRLFITAPKTPLRGSGWKLLELSLVWAFLDQNKSIATANQSLVNITRRQWELKLSKARENAIDQVAVSFGLAPNWLRQRREIPRSITEQSS